MNWIKSYRKIFGIFGLLTVVFLFTAWQAPDSFLSPENLQNTVRWTALFGIISIGVSFVIITGGIDLSIGSVVALVGCILAMSMQTSYVPTGQLTIVGVDPDQQAIEVREDLLDSYSPGTPVRIGENWLTVASVDGQTIMLEEPLELTETDVEEALGSSPETVHLLGAVREISPKATDTIRRGGNKMELRTVVVDGDFSEAVPDDRVTLLYKIGLPKEFPIHSVETEGDQTTITFITRSRQKIRPSAERVVVAKRSQKLPTGFSLALVLALATGIGLVHGLLVTKIGLQPFIVTLCGLLFYRGVARYITTDQQQGFGNEYPDLKALARGDFLNQLTGDEYVFDIPMPFIYLMILGVIAAVFLNKTIYGRYMLALGRNEEAARYSGINTDRMVILSYMICSFCAGVAGILFALDLNSVQPSSHGEFYELYAIAAAVLGGCSLRGGEGSILGVIIAAAVMRVLNNAINLIDGIDTSTEFAIIGMVILLGVITDELVKRVSARRRAVAQSTGN